MVMAVSHLGYCSQGNQFAPIVRVNIHQVPSIVSVSIHQVPSQVPSRAIKSMEVLEFETLTSLYFVCTL